MKAIATTDGGGTDDGTRNSAAMDLPRFFVDTVQRLAATLPPPASSAEGQHSAREMARHLRDELSTSQSLVDLLVLTAVFMLVLELVSNIVYHVPRFFSAKAIPVRGKHLDEFSFKDKAFVTFNKCLTGLFVYAYFGYLWSVRKMPGDEHESADELSLQHNHTHVHDHDHKFGNHDHCCGGGKGIWALDELSFANTVLPVPMLFVVYDFFYTLLHWALHVKAVYSFVHKHHHHQKAPSRANIDAVNVHPLEFALGEFNHVLALHLVVGGMPLVCYHGIDVSWLGALLFISLGGILAGLNHTRHDAVARVGKYTIFDSKHHDVHHRIPQSNYGQYTVLWDRIFGTFRDYNPDDRVNPAAQLDPRTGKVRVPEKIE